MSPDQVELLKQFILRELDQFRTTAAETRAESSKDHDEVKASIQRVDEKLDDVRERVVTLEANDQLRLRSLNWIKWGVGILIAVVGILVPFSDQIFN